MADAPPILSVEGVGKRFGGLQALEDVSLELYENELFGLIGPNGAGKSTLLNVISSVHAPTEGSIYFRDEDITSDSQYKIAKRGVVRTFQEAKHFNEISGKRNIRAAQVSNRLLRASVFFGPLVGESKDDEEERLRVVDMVGLSSEALSKEPSDMTHFERTKLAIARALVNDPEVLMLDEPFAGLTSEETDTIAGLVEELGDSDITVLVIDHDVGTVTSIAERVAVLDQGQILMVDEPDAVLADERTQAAYFGE